jgi:hypothetical protein
MSDEILDAAEAIIAIPAGSGVPEGIDFLCG